MSRREDCPQATKCSDDEMLPCAHPLCPRGVRAEGLKRPTTCCTVPDGGVAVYERYDLGNGNFMWRELRTEGIRQCSAIAQLPGCSDPPRRARP